MWWNPQLLLTENSNSLHQEYYICSFFLKYFQGGIIAVWRHFYDDKPSTLINWRKYTVFQKVVHILYKGFWVITRRHSWYETNVSGLMFVPSSGWITRRNISPERLISYQEWCQLITQKPLYKLTTTAKAFKHTIYTHFNRATKCVIYPRVLYLRAEPSVFYT